ncbi:hypothetical protein OJ252_1165 [Cryptosporidium canis]|uniref:Uncharacterized protein n=1 Tax=Cryptosporidium canis TaxID=195482 RepID=A0ABQ8P906_9CRYT|nr:hypothetical protein OJ252_1165 [Cryptosporidium canis]
MEGVNLVTKKIPRRYSLTKTEKSTLGKSLLRYIQVSHYFEKPTVNILNENVRKDLINKQIEEVEKQDLDKLRKENEKKALKELDNMLEECIDRRVNLHNIDKQKSWLKKMVDEDPPEHNSDIKRKISFGKSIKENRNMDWNSSEMSDLEENYELLKRENMSDEMCNIHIKSEKGFPRLNFQYNNVEDTIVNWNPPMLNGLENERDFTRKLRVLRKGELVNVGDDSKENEKCEKDESADSLNQTKDDEDEKDDHYYKIPVIGELVSDHELRVKFEEEDNIYLRQYLDEIKCDTSIIDFVKEKHNYTKFKKWLKKNKLRLKKNKIIPDDSHLNSERNHNFDSDEDQDDEARDLHTRNDFRRFDILLDSNIFGYCDYDEADHVLDGILEIEKSKRKRDNPDDHKENDITDDKCGEETKNTKLKEGLQLDQNKEVEEEEEEEEDDDDDDDDDDEDDSEIDDIDEDKKEDDEDNDEEEISKDKALPAKFGECSSKEKTGMDNLQFNRMLNMLLNAGAEIDDDEEKIIKEERKEEQSLGRLRMPKSLDKLGNMNNESSAETLEEYYEKKRKIRIELRSKVLKENKEEKDYSMQLFYNNPQMLEAFIKKMDNQISERKKRYEEEKSERYHLSYRLNFMIERNARLNYSLKKAEKEVNNLRDEYEDKLDYIKSYSKKLEDELSGLERLQGILINSLGMLSQWCVCQPEYLDPVCTKNWEKSSISLVPGGRQSHALLICKRICHFDSRLSNLYNSMYIHNYKAGLKILKRREVQQRDERNKILEEKEKEQIKIQQTIEDNPIEINKNDESQKEVINNELHDKDQVNKSEESSVTNSDESKSNVLNE